MNVEHAVSVMRQYDVTAETLNAIAVEFRISEDQFVIDVVQGLLCLELMPPTPPQCMKHLDVLSETSKSLDVVTEAAAPEDPRFKSTVCEHECKAGKTFYCDQCLTKSSFYDAGDRHREIHANTPPKEAGPPGTSAEVSLPSSPVSPMIIDGDELVGGGDDGNGIERLDMWTPGVARSIDNDEVKKAARKHSKINDSCLQALESCVSSNKKRLDKTWTKFIDFELEVSNALNKFKEDIQSQYLKQDENTQECNALKQMKDEREVINATKSIEDDNAEQNLELTTYYQEELDFCQDLQKRIQDATIKAYDVHLNSNVIVSVKNACTVYVYESIKVCHLNVAGLAKRLAIPEFIEFIKKYDILCFSETNVFEGDKVDIDKYIHYNKYRQDAKIRSGGIGVYVHEKLQPFVKEIKSNCDYVLWIEIEDVFSRINDSVVLGAVYIPPKNTHYWKENMHQIFEKDVKKTFSAFRYRNLLLAGDFNSHTGTLSELTDKNALPRPSLSETICQQGKRLIKLCQEEHLFILNGRLFKDKDIGEITFRRDRSESVIDYVISRASCKALFKSFEVIGSNRNTFSDGHSTLVFEIGCNTLPCM